MSNTKRAHEKLNEVKWDELFIYTTTSPTFLQWKSPTRIGNKGAPTKRASMTAGGIGHENNLVLHYHKSAYSIPKIVWVMHNGAIPEGYTIWFADNNKQNARIENLVLKEESGKLSEKYSESLKEYLEYDETSPSSLRWKSKISKSATQKVGDTAGSLDALDGYWKIHGLGYHYKVHRIVWFMHNGKIPEGFMIDHISGNRGDNSISNLRLVTREGNARNRAKNKNNTTGHNMISYYEGYNKNGTLIQKYSVSINVKAWTRISKSFSCIKYGKELALQKSIQWRDKILGEINSQGAGYTDRHGT